MGSNLDRYSNKIRALMNSIGDDHDAFEQRCREAKMDNLFKVCIITNERCVKCNHREERMEYKMARWSLDGLENSFNRTQELQQQYCLGCTDENDAECAVEDNKGLVKKIKSEKVKNLPLVAAFDGVKPGFPRQIDMTPYSICDGSKQQYGLYALAVHGDLCFVRFSDGWKQFIDDDAVGVPCALENVESQDASILFYILETVEQSLRRAGQKQALKALQDLVGELDQLHKGFKKEREDRDMAKIKNENVWEEEQNEKQEKVRARREEAKKKKEELAKEKSDRAKGKKKEQGPGQGQAI